MALADNQGRFTLRRNPLTIIAGCLIGAAAVSALLHWVALSVGLSVIAVAILAYQPAREPVAEEAAPPAAPTPTAAQEPPRDPIERMSAALAAIDMPLYLIDSREDILFQNAAAIEAFGAMEANAHITTRLRSPAILDCLRETIAKGNVNTVEYSERHPSTRVYLVRVAPVASDGRSSHFILSFRDISESRVVERMRSDFVANASHELRTPLASLQGFIETLQGPAKNDPKAGERFLGIMLEQVQRMNRLVDDLLSLSRIELKAHIAPSDKVELGPLLGHVRDALLPQATSLGVEIILDIPGEPVSVVGDRDELIQVFENLVQNACKYAQEGKRVEVTLSAARPGHGAEVCIRDFGPGIAEEHIPRLTERFYRVNVEASRSKKGTGLGLAIVKHILTRHRARLLVKSEVGKGSIFTVRF